MDGSKGELHALCCLGVATVITGTCNPLSGSDGQFNDDGDCFTEKGVMCICSVCSLQSFPLDDT